MSNPAYGQMQPEDGQTDLNAIYFICRQLIARLDTMKLVQVTAVHPGSGTPPAPGTVDVQLLVSQVDGNNNPVKHGVVFGLPVFRVQGGPWAIVCDPAVNDYGYVVCADRDSSLVVKNGGSIQNPGSGRRYNVADGVYVGGLLNAVPAGTFWLKSDGTFVLTDKNTNVLQSTASGLNLKVGGTTILAITSTGISVTGSLNVSGDTVSDGVDLKLHVHSGVTTGSSDTGPPV